MRIGFLGNQNNYPFLLARALRALGHDVLVLIDDRDRLNRPEYRYREIAYPYPSWIEEVPALAIDDAVFDTPAWRHALARLGTCDAVVLNTKGIAAAGRIDVPAVCLATGSDLELYAWPKAAERYARSEERRRRPRDWASAACAMRRPTTAAWLDLAGRAPAPLYRLFRKHVFRRFARLQQRGLARAAAVCYFPPGAVAHGDRILGACVPPSTRRTFLCMTDLDAIAPQPMPSNSVFRLFNATRFDWARPFPPMVGAWVNKGNDILVRGIALYHHRTNRPIDVRFVTKGQSVAATRELIRACGIDHLVTWRAEMSQREVLEEYALADAVSEQFGGHVVGMAGYDAMASARPVLCNWRPEVFDPFFGERAPVAQAATPEEVAAQLERLQDPATRRDFGARGRQFVERRLSPARAAHWVLEAFREALDPAARAEVAA